VSVHLVVTYADHQIGFYPVPEDGGWRLDAASRCLIIGHGVPRTQIPLDSVQCFVIEECRTDLREKEGTA
jgi:hypothetical protein